MGSRPKIINNFGLNSIASLLLRPFTRFFKTSAKGGVILILASVLAMALANSSVSHFYGELWEIPIGFSAGAFSMEQGLRHWINDGLMAVFFFLVGLEIKREVLSGDLSSPAGASLPIAAALGGMIFPALIYAAVNLGGEGAHGWGVPMATDIAFSLGVIALLKGRVPTSLVVFLTALAIVDDLGAILVIALFYSGGIDLAALAGAFGFLALSVLFNMAGVRKTLPYVLIGVFMWLLLSQSGVHATVAGVLLAMTVPANRKINQREFADKVYNELNCVPGEGGAVVCPVDMDRQSAIVAIEDACHDAEAPLQHIEHHLHPWVTYFILPVFAFANAGVDLSVEGFKGLISEPVSLGVMLGLFFGKQLGIFAFSFLAVKTGLSRLPKGVGWREIYGVSILGGIGFTMSLFIAALAFHGTPAYLESAKGAILYASVISAAAGYVFLRRSPKGRIIKAVPAPPPDRLSHKDALRQNPQSFMAENFKSVIIVLRRS